MPRSALCQDRFLAVLLFCSLSAYLCLYLFLGLFAHPAADDFWFANKVVSEGFLQSQVYWYTGWTGRYASTALISSYIALFGLIRFFWLVPVFLIIATWSSFSYLVFSLSRRAQLTAFDSACAGLILTALYISGVPSTAETFYWLAGGITYQLANCLYLVLLATLSRMQPGREETCKRTFSFSCTLVVLIAGLNETAMFLQFVTLVLVLFLSFRGESRHPYLLPGLLGLSLFCAAVVIAAPGNAVRSANFPLAHNLLFSLKQSFSYAVSQFLSWSAPGPLWLATMLWLPLASKAATSCRAAAPNAKGAATAVLAWLALLVALHFPAFWSMGGPPPERTQSTIYLLFVAGWFMTLTLLAAFMEVKERQFSAPRLGLLTVALAAVLFATANGATACLDLLTAPGYSKRLEERYALVTGAGTKAVEVKVPALLEYPATIAIHFGDIGADKDNWKNRNFAEYLGVKSVATTW